MNFINCKKIKIISKVKIIKDILFEFFDRILEIVKTLM